jgi:hypothetical protein
MNLVDTIIIIPVGTKEIQLLYLLYGTLLSIGVYGFKVIIQFLGRYYYALHSMQVPLSPVRYLLTWQFLIGTKVPTYLS